MRQQLGVAPSNAVDVATKTYVDAGDAADPGFGQIAPPVTGSAWYAKMPGLVATNTGTPTSGRVWFIPFWIGQSGWTTDAIGINISTAQSGGTIGATGAIYPDDGTGFPDTSNRLSVTGNITLTATGNVWTAFGSNVALSPGKLYWVAFQFNQTVAPTTAPAFTGISSLAYEMPAAQATTLGTAIRAWYVTATTTPTTTTAHSGMSTDGGNVPVVALRRA